MRRLLQHWTESSIITHLKRRVSLEEQKAQKRGPFPSWKTDRLLDLRVLPSHCSQWFCRELCRPMLQLFFEMMIFRNSIQNGTEIWYQWRKSHLTTYWKDLYIFKNTRVWGSLRPYWNCMIWRLIRRKLEPDYHRLKTMVKRSIEQDLRNKEFGARNGNYERNAVVKNQGTKQREQRILEDCWHWESNGQCVKGDNCSFRHDIE